MNAPKAALTRRNFLRAALATGLLLTACAPATDPAVPEAEIIDANTPAPEGTLIAYWTFWADRWGEFQQQIVDEYNAAQDALQVEMVIVPWGELSVQLLAAISAGNPPDFTMIARNEIAEWAANGGLMPLDEYIAATDEVKPVDWFAAAWDACRWLDKIYAQPFESVTYAAWYHQDLFAQVGLDPTAPPITWDAVDIAADPLTQGNASDGYTSVGFIPWHARPDLLGWLSGGRWYDEATRQITAVTAENLAALTWVKQYADKYGGEALERFRQAVGAADTADDPFYLGQLAMVWKGSWSLSARQEYAADVPVGVHALPYRAGARHASLIQGSACVLPTGAPQPDPAYQFLAYMSINGVTQWVSLAADLVSRPQQTDIYPSALPDNEKFRHSWQLYNQALAYAQHEPAIPMLRMWNDQLQAAVDAVVLGQKTPEQALQDAQNVTQRELDKALPS